MRETRIRILCAVRLMAILMFVAGSVLAFGQDSGELAQKGKAAYDAKDYGKSADYYLQAAAKDPSLNEVWYNAACSLALSGQIDKAFAAIDKAVENGWSDLDWLQQDPDLSVLRSDRRWKALTAKAEAKVGEAYVSKGSMRFWDGPAISSLYKETLTQDEMVAGLSKFWSETKNFFAYFDRVRGLDWDQTYVDALGKVREARSTADFYWILRQMAAKLQAGDTEIVAPDGLAESALARPGIRVREIGGRAVVVAATEDAAKAGAVVGSEIVAVEGKPLKDFGEAFTVPSTSASTPQQLIARAYSDQLLEGPIKRPVALAVEQPDGKRVSLRLPRMPLPAWEAAVGIPAYEFKMLPGDVAYFALNSFGRAHGLLQNDWAKASQASAMIIDLRECDNGIEWLPYMLLNNLTQEPVPTYRSSVLARRASDRNAPGIGTLEGSDKFGTIWNPSKNLFSKPLVLLVGGKTSYSGEHLVASARALGRAKLIGEPTAGCSGVQTYSIRLPGGLQARITSARIEGPTESFVGRGFQPDRLVAGSVEDFRRGRDAVLEAALEELGLESNS